jgi:hypothetical protein
MRRHPRAPLSGQFEYTLARLTDDGDETLHPLKVDYEYAPGYPSTYWEPGADDTVWLEIEPALVLTKDEQAELELAAFHDASNR